MEEGEVGEEGKTRLICDQEHVRSDTMKRRRMMSDNSANGTS
jgi:hypothetical protein